MYLDLFHDIIALLCILVLIGHLFLILKNQDNIGHDLGVDRRNPQRLSENTPVYDVKLKIQRIAHYTANY